MKEIELTSINHAYYYNEGYYQEEYDQLRNSHTLFSNFLNNFNKAVFCSIVDLYIEFCKNSNNKALISETIEGKFNKCEHCEGTGYIKEEPCSYCNGSGGEKEDDIINYHLSKPFEIRLQLIQEYLLLKNNTEAINIFNEVKELINNPNVSINFININKYDRLIDYIIYLILNNSDDNSPVPEWFIKEINNELC
jgi:hypothetical protein